MRNWADVSPTEASALSAVAAEKPKRGMGGRLTAERYAASYKCPLHCHARAYVDHGHVRVSHESKCPLNRNNRP